MIELRFVRRWPDAPSAVRFGWLWHWRRRIDLDAESVPGREPGQNILFIHVGRLLLTLLVAGVLAYGSAAVTAWWWFHRQLGSRIAFADVAWPPRWPRLSQARTEALFDHGQQAFAEHRLSEAAWFLRAGLRRAPARDDARLLLARLCTAAQDFPHAFAVIDEPLPRRPIAPALFEFAVNLALYCEDYPRVLRYTESALAQPNPAPGVARFALQSRARAFAALGRGAEAVRVAAQLETTDDPASFVARIEALLADGQYAAAVALADAAQVRHPADFALLNLGCRAACAARDFTALDTQLRRAIARFPDAPEPRSAAVLAWWQAGETPRALAELHAFLLRFDSDAEVTYQLSTSATALGAAPLIEEIHLRALSLGQNTARLKANLIEARLINGDVAGLRRTRIFLPQLAATDDPVLQLWPTVVDSVFQVLDGDALASGLPLQTIVRQLRLPPAAYARFVRFLLSAGRPAAASELLDHALAVFPESPSLRALAPTAHDALAAARDARPAAPAPASELLTETDFFSTAEKLLAAHHHAELAALLVAHRRSEPPWFTSRRREVDWLELRLAVASNDVLAARRLAQLYLNGDAARLKQTLTLAANLPLPAASATRAALTDAMLRQHPEAQPELQARGLLAAPDPERSTVAKLGP